MNYLLDVSHQTKIVITIIGLGFIFFNIWLVYRRKLSENMALGWSAITIISVTVVLSGPILSHFVRITGIKSGAVAISMAAFAFIFAILILFSIKMSTLTNQNRKLAQQTGLLEQKIDKLELQLSNRLNSDPEIM